ncbi:MAG: GspH/FimT family pseudopilin [Magnetococcales bacterium]|nr:GspH/FimT family pseudopilin [Magnetococcales bacterium]
MENSKTTIFYGNKNSSGFTLIELVLVMLLVGILTVVVSARWPGSSITLQSYADHLNADLDLARSMALSRGESVTIKSSAGNSYSITDSSGSTLYNNNHLGSVTMDGFSVVFDSYGSPGGTDQDIDLGLNGKNITLRIVGDSGVVVVL